MIDTIVIIGNGFDRWLGLKTSYSDFHKYYLEQRDELVKKKIEWNLMMEPSKSLQMWNLYMATL